MNFSFDDIWAINTAQIIIYVNPQVNSFLLPTRQTLERYGTEATALYTTVA